MGVLVLHKFSVGLGLWHLRHPLPKECETPRFKVHVVLLAQVLLHLAEQLFHREFLDLLAREARIRQIKLGLEAMLRPISNSVVVGIVSDRVAQTCCEGQDD